MGTSQSSSGAPSGVPMVPPWVPPLPPPVDVATPQPPPPPVPIALAGRFSGARRSLGGFAGTGDAAAMRRGVGHYIKSGYGGSATASRRFGGTATTAGSLYGALSGGPAGAGRGPADPLDPTRLAGRSAEEVIDAVIEAVRPIDGTQDAEAGRASIRDALSELLSRFPDADLLSLNEDQRAFAIERFVAMDVYRRLDLDLGKTIREKAPSAVTAQSRLKQIKSYVKETVAASFRQLRDAGHAMTTNRVGSIVRSALTDAFQVFESYA